MIGTILCIIWGAAVMIAGIAMLYNVGQYEGGGVATIAGIILLPLIFCIAAGPYAMLHEARSPDLVTLKKDDFVCVKSHTEETYVNGGILVETVCDAYGRKIGGAN